MNANAQSSLDIWQLVVILSSVPHLIPPVNLPDMGLQAPGSQKLNMIKGILFSQLQLYRYVHFLEGQICHLYARENAKVCKSKIL